MTRPIARFVASIFSKPRKDATFENLKQVTHGPSLPSCRPGRYFLVDKNSSRDSSTKRRRQKHTRSVSKDKATDGSWSESNDQMARQRQRVMAKQDTSSVETDSKTKSGRFIGPKIICLVSEFSRKAPYYMVNRLQKYFS